VRFFYILIGAAAHVLQVSRNPQGLILSSDQLLFERLHTRLQALICRVGSRACATGLRIQSLFVSHSISPVIKLLSQ
jgi:hypothetical protein